MELSRIVMLIATASLILFYQANDDSAVGFKVSRTIIKHFIIIIIILLTIFHVFKRLEKI